MSPPRSTTPPSSRKLKADPPRPTGEKLLGAADPNIGTRLGSNTLLVCASMKPECEQ
jgi:hypothetical protein